MTAAIAVMAGRIFLFVYLMQDQPRAACNGRAIYGESNLDRGGLKMRDKIAWEAIDADFPNKVCSSPNV